MYQSSPIVQIVSQVIIDLPSDSPAETLEYCRGESLKWAQRKAGTHLPPEAWQGHQFDLKGLHTQPVSATSLDGYWAARIDDADKSVAQRTWITEIGINNKNENTVTFGCRLYCRALGENPPYPPTIPSVVRRIASAHSVTIDGRPLRTSAWWIDDQRTVDQLVAFLLQPTRQRSVIAVAAPSAGNPPALSVNRLASSLIGTAHVAYVTEDASYLLTESVGREFSVFSGAVRTYRTGFYPEADQPSAHPLALYDRITNWSMEDSSFEAFLVKRTMGTYLSSRPILTELPSFATIRRAAAEKERTRLREQGASESELLALALDDNEKLRQELQEEKATSDSLVSLAEDERDQVQSELDLQRQIIHTLRGRIDGLETSLTISGNSEDVKIPDDLGVVRSWCEQYLGDSVFILNRAYRGLSKSQFEDIELIYKALLLLRNHYVPTRRVGGIERRNAFEEACQELGLEESESIGRNRAGEEKDSYFADYAGRHVLLDRHLKKGEARDPRYCFRLYFFWDQDDERVVVGWLPSHLDIRST